MTREEAIKTLKGEAWLCCAEKWNEALDMAISALSENKCSSCKNYRTSICGNCKKFDEYESEDKK